jgi:cell division protein FtsB
MMRGRKAAWGAYLGAIALAAALSAADPSGLRKYWKLSRDVHGMRAENERLAGENARLAREVHALRTDPAALERAAREELRFVRPGERVYFLTPSDHPERSDGGAGAESRDGAEPGAGP